MIKFTNTQKLSQVDWDKEIANQPEVSSDAQASRASTAVQVWSLAQHYLKANVEKAIKDDDVKKSNLMRIHEYFYGKFVYHHALYYGKDCDLIETEKEFRRGDHPLVELRKQFGKLPKSKLPMKKIKELEYIFTSIVEAQRAERKAKDGGYEEVKTLIEQEGLKCVKPKGLRKEGDRDTVCTIHDGVRYHLYLMKKEGKRSRAEAKEEVNDHKHVIDRYHPLVKQIYDKIKKFKDVGDVWAMAGGGMQCQVFFGNNTGYLAILYLDMKNTKAKLGKDYILQVNWNKNDILFKDFKVDGIKVRTSEEVYGKDKD